MSDSVVINREPGPLNIDSLLRVVRAYKILANKVRHHSGSLSCQWSRIGACLASVLNRWLNRLLLRAAVEIGILSAEEPLSLRRIMLLQHGSKASLHSREGSVDLGLLIEVLLVEHQRHCFHWLSLRLGILQEHGVGGRLLIVPVVWNVASSLLLWLALDCVEERGHTRRR